MARRGWMWVLLWFVAACAVESVADGAGAIPSPGVVWLKGVIHDKEGDARLQAPLEWLALVDSLDKTSIQIDDQKIDCVALWEEHRGLESGKSLEVRRGKTKEGRPYTLIVESRAPSREKSDGKVRLLVKEKNGKSVDVGFPLDLPTTIESLAGTFCSVLGIEKPKVEPDRSSDSWAPILKLGDYGPFVLVEAFEEDGARVTISIE